MNLKRRVSYFLRGVGSLLNIAPPAQSHKIPNPYEETDDAEMLRRDWQAVGDDLRFGIEKVKRELHEQRG